MGWSMVACRQTLCWSGGWALHPNRQLDRKETALSTWNLKGHPKDTLFPKRTHLLNETSPSSSTIFYEPMGANSIQTTTPTFPQMFWNYFFNELCLTEKILFFHCLRCIKGIAGISAWIARVYHYLCHYHVIWLNTLFSAC